VLDGVYRNCDGVPVFHEAAAPTNEELEALLLKIITRVMRLLTRQGYLIEEQGMTYLAEADTDRALAPLQAASCTYRIALGPRAVTTEHEEGIRQQILDGLIADKGAISRYRLSP